MKRSFIFALFLVAACAENAVCARAAENPLPPMKRLGRGVADRRSGAKLQLACVGKVKEATKERGCELLQFLKTDVGGQESLIGPVLDIRDDERRANRQLRDELRCYGLFKHATAGRFFLFTAAMMGDLGSGRRERCDAPTYSTLPEEEFWKQVSAKHGRHERTRRTLAFTFGIGGFAGIGVLALTHVIPEVVGMFGGIEIYGLAFALDAAIYPIRLLFQSGGGPLGVRGKNVAALESRSQLAWQLKPKRISTRKFRRVIAQLEKFQGHGPKIEPLVASVPAGGTEVFSFVDVGDDSRSDAIDADSNPVSRPQEWAEVVADERIGEENE